MKAVFVLALVLVIAAVVVNANEDHKDRKHHHKHRNHKKGDRYEHNGKKDRHGNKHEGKKDRHGEHEGKNDRSHTKNDGKKDRHSENHSSRPDHAHNKFDRNGSELCPTNSEPNCKPKQCIVSCADNHNVFREFLCSYQNWLNDLLSGNYGGEVSGIVQPAPTTEDPSVEERAKVPCTKENENFKCICVVGYMPNDADDSCVKKEDCPLKGEGGDGEDGAHTEEPVSG